MNSFLVRYKMGELCHVKHGYPFDGSKFDTQGKYIVLTPGNFYEKGGFKRTIGKEKWYSDEFPKEYLCHKGDLIVAMTQQAEGLLGSTAIVPEEHLYLHNQRIGLVSHNAEIVDKLYLYYLFMTKSVRKQIADSASGTKIKHTSPDKIYAVEVYVPDIDTQKKNAQLLYSLDKKIDENAYICAELEAMAKTLYNYWFVQFDFPDKNGRPYRTSGGEMVWNAQLKREIPKGWKVTCIGEITANFDSQRVPLSQKERDAVRGDIPYYGATGIMDYVNKYIFDGQYVLLAEDGSVMDDEGYPIVQMIWDKTWINNHAHVLKGINGYGNELLYFVLKEIPVVKIMTGSIQKKINQNNLNAYLVPEIPDYLKTIFGDLATGIFSKMHELDLEKCELTKLRDWLLPMLMNGQARVE